MVMTIRTNAAAMTAQRNMQSTQLDLNRAMGRLSSGYRITKASDDAAGLGVSTNLQAQMKSYEQAIRNGNDGLSVVQTAEAALNETSQILIRLRQLTMQSASDGVGATERAYIQTEADELILELDRINAVTEFNGQPLFAAPTGLTFQIGLRATANDFITVDTTFAVDSAALGVAAINLSTDATTSRAELAGIDAAINLVSGYRATLGAQANRIQSVLNTVAVASEEITAANSRIIDADIAAESSNMASAQVRSQAGTAVLAQANQVPQNLLRLLG